MSEKIKKLSEQLTMKKKNVFDCMSEKEIKDAFDFSEGYVDYLFNSKIEREAVNKTIAILKKDGYKEYKLGGKVKKGGKYYFNNRGKTLIAFEIGTGDINDGFRMLNAHIDSPRLDLKQNPLYEDNDIGYFKTHYYGGIRKYQWPTIPLALHGTVTLAGGKTIDITIGEDAGDPVFVITDLLPHLGKEQNQKHLGEAFPAESLNIIVGTQPIYDGKKPADIENPVKLNILKLLNEKYGIIEKDFICAELCAVPAGHPVDVGLDRSLIGAYAHDDKVCAYPALKAMLDREDKTKTTVLVLCDKEETGSCGATGMQSTLLFELIDKVVETLGGDGVIARSNSMCLSADVCACYDPNFSDTFDKKNSSYLNCGVSLCKFHGSGGKYSTNDASSELLVRISDTFDKAGVVWQMGGFGKVDAGGGGTIAKYVSQHNVDTLDVGVPVLSMHAPFEIISKADLYQTYKAFKAFCNN